MQASYIRYPLNFLRPAGTSRGTLHTKACWFLKLETASGEVGLGEVSFIPGLGSEGAEQIEKELERLCSVISTGKQGAADATPSVPGVRFALESALKDLENGGTRILFPSEFTQGDTGIPINGLIWMGDRRYMLEQIREKVEQGFRVLKMKVGALAQNEEMEILNWMRSEFGEKDLEIRLDANGAWNAGEARERMARLAVFGIHSIEQPLPPGQAEAMAGLCRDPVIPVALDEELLGRDAREHRMELLEQIRPAYLIIKPGLLGGFSESLQWIDAAEGAGAGWWITSALESAVGLSAIAQWTARLGVTIPQGLGTGNIYSNSFTGPLSLEKEKLWYRPENEWNLDSVIN